MVHNIALYHCIGAHVSSTNLRQTDNHKNGRYQTYYLQLIKMFLNVMVISGDVNLGFAEQMVGPKNLIQRCPEKFANSPLDWSSLIKCTILPKSSPWSNENQSEISIKSGTQPSNEERGIDALRARCNRTRSVTSCPYSDLMKWNFNKDYIISVR